jgi:hypothetical protein
MPGPPVPGPPRLIYMIGTLAGEELPAAGQEVPFSTLTGARQCQEQVYRSGLTQRDWADGFGVYLGWEQNTEFSEDGGEELSELTDAAGDVEPRTGFYVRTVRLFDTAEELAAAAELAETAATERSPE